MPNETYGSIKALLRLYQGSVQVLDVSTRDVEYAKRDLAQAKRNLESAKRNCQRGLNPILRQ
jgi:hypothetical protein